VLVCGADNKWAVAINCANSNKECTETTAGSGVYGCEYPPGSCTVDGFTVIEQSVSFDPELIYVQYYEYWAGGADRSVYIYNVPGFPGAINPGATGTVTFTSDSIPANINDAGFSIIGLYTTDGGTTVKLFMPIAGTAEVTSMAATIGGAVSINLSGLSMAEILLDDQGNTTVVGGGELWCVDSAALTANVDYYDCPSDMTEGDLQCWSYNNNTQYHTIVSCTNGKLRLSEECYATGKTCDPTSTAPVCQ